MARHLPLDDLLDDLRSRGARVTTARRLVLAELIRRGADHPTADQITTRIRRTNPELHLSTIYRTLEFLEDTGLVVRAGFGDGATTYHLAADRHHHAVCEVCGTIIELPESALAGVVASLRRDHGFAASPHHVTIPGVCARCSAR
jgi:Fur family transcriptional regulator, ferric uptake regulator